MSNRAPSARRPAVALVAALAVLLAVAAPVAAAKPSGAGGGGKPGYPDRIMWSGLEWQIKTSNSAVGPGPNIFAKENVSVDSTGALHLTIQRRADGKWTCAEIIGPKTHGYGTYTFTIHSAVSALDPNVVLGLFTWSDRAQQAHREIDIEFARWGGVDVHNAQYVVQPHDKSGHLFRFSQTQTVTTIHSFTWRPGSVSFESRLAGETTPYASFTYSGSDVPQSKDERVRLNLWLFQGRAPTNEASVEVVVESFFFQPLP